MGDFYIELFSGAEEWSRALRRRGRKVYSFDILQGEKGDLLRKGVMIDAVPPEYADLDDLEGFANASDF